MKKNLIFAVVSAMATGLILMFFILYLTNTPSEAISEADVTKTVNGNQEKTDEYYTRVSPGNIEVTAIFLNPNYGDKFESSIAFYIRLDTHSGDLFSYDIEELTELIDNDGRRYKPIKWSESENSWGHHRSGLLEFERFDKSGRDLLSQERLKLVIKGIERDIEFVWDVE
jgi:hypothetical protein